MNYTPGVSSVTGPVIGRKTADQTGMKASVLTTMDNQSAISITTPTPKQEAEATNSKQHTELEDEYELVQVLDPSVKFELEYSSQPTIVKGNLRRNIDFWKSIGASQFIVDVIEYGYKLPFSQLPESLHNTKNNRSALSQVNFVEQAIKELVDSKRVIKVVKQPFVINPLSVSVQANGKKRLILDLRHVNRCLKKQRVKYEDWKVALSYFSQNAYMFSFDLKSGYHHVDIFHEHQTYIGFAWKFEGSMTESYFVFTVLPFGLSTAPHIFTKLLKPLEKHWRCQGINIAIFLDDGWSIDQHYQTCKAIAKSVKCDLNEAGFITNDEKSVWEPSQNLDWLGLTWNTVDGSIQIVQRRLSKMSLLIDQLIQSEFRVSARKLASFVGQVISTGPVLRNIARIMTRHCSMSVANAQFWDYEIILDEYAKQEIYFWKANLLKHSKRNCFIYKDPVYFAYSDASASGCGATIRMGDEFICHKMWTPQEQEKSSTRRELSAIKFALQSFATILEGSHVKWFTDNQATVRIVEIGSMKFDLHLMSIRIFNFCVERKVCLDIQWIARTMNQRADYISRLIDPDDWQITTECFQILETLWGPHSIDGFANYYNTKLERFFSRYWNPGTSGVDFFVQNLKDENCLVVPPLNIVARVLQYMNNQKAAGTLVVPRWESAPYWPILVGRFKQFVRGYKIFNGNEVLIHGRNSNSLLGSTRFTGDVIAIRVNFQQGLDQTIPLQTIQGVERGDRSPS